MLNNWKDLQLSYNSSNYSPRMIHYSLASIRELICAIFYKILLIISLVVAEITFKVIQDHWQWRYLIVHIWLTSSCPPKVCMKFLSTAGAAGLTKQIAGVEELIRQSKADDQERTPSSDFLTSCSSLTSKCLFLMTLTNVMTSWPLWM